VATVAFQQTSKRFGDVTAVDGLDLDVADGEFLVLLGPSGCGKTTALRMVAGLEDVTEGSIAIGGVDVTDLEPQDRDIAMVFQSYALYPHLSVGRNIEFPLRKRIADKAERAARVQEAARALDLLDLLDRKPGQLSGGQRQRVALARAIVRQPSAFLMDEPLSNLDAKLRIQTRAEIVALQARLETTTIYVTHDQVEAMTMGHRIAVMQGGSLQQVASPAELYAKPANAFVAKFVGNPGMNLVKAVVDTASQSVTVAGQDATAAFPGADAFKIGGEVTIGFRAEDVALSSEGIAATVLLVERLGSEVHVVVSLADGESLIVRQGPSEVIPEIAAAVFLKVGGPLHHFDAMSGARR
jgi:multiple sugar transport system ATP-binding protein